MPFGQRHVAAYPGQTGVYQTSEQQLINADGSSNFKANGNAVIPVKFGLASGSGQFLFESIGSNTSPTDDYSYVSFSPSSSLTFNEITELSAVYAFTYGDCHGGSLRWQVRTTDGHSLFIYYGKHPQFGNGGADGCIDDIGDGQTGSNLITLSDRRFDTSQLAERSTTIIQMPKRSWARSQSSGHRSSWTPVGEATRRPA
jgi:hypothetical protein